MLIEGAIRFAERARQHWRAGKNHEASEALIRAQDILGELTAELNVEGRSDLVKKTAGVYLFIFRSLTEAGLHRDESKLDAALKVLEVQRDTWRQVCRQVAPQNAAVAAGAPSAVYRQAPTAAPIAPPNFAMDSTPIEPCAGGFSLEA